MLVYKTVTSMKNPNIQLRRATYLCHGAKPERRIDRGIRFFR